jgi:hypothetical protein
MLEEEPLLARPAPELAPVGLPYSPHDLSEIPRQLGTPFLDVLPALLRQDNPAPVGIERGRQWGVVFHPPKLATLHRHTSRGL